MKRLTSLASLAALAVAVAGACFYLSPYLAFHDLREAARAGDDARVAARVDVPALRASVRDEVRGAAEREIRSRGGGALAPAGGWLAGALAGSLVEAAASPEGIAALAEGGAPDGRGGWSFREDGGEVELERRWEDLSTFVVRVRGENGRAGPALVMRREGLRWRLAGVRLADG